MAFSANAIKALITEYGEKLLAITFDNSSVIVFNNGPGTPSHTDIVYKTFGDAECMGVSMKDARGNPCTKWHDIECIQMVTTRDSNRAVDPTFLK